MKLPSLSLAPPPPNTTLTAESGKEATTDYFKLKLPQHNRRRRYTRAKLIWAGFMLLLVIIPVLVWLQTSTSALLLATADEGLSIPNFASDQEKQSRAAEVQALASQIVNEKRTWRIGQVDFPFSDGPVARPGSLAARIQQEEVAQLDEFANPDSFALYELVTQSKFDTLADYATFYDKATRFAPRPVSTDISDESFGYQRTTTKGFSLRAFRAESDSLPSDSALDNGANIATICGANHTSLASVEANKSLFVSNFSDFAQWSDPNKTGIKFVAAVVAFYCFNEDANKLLPLAIRIVDTNVTYTPFDKPEEWTLAKMAVDAAEVTFQQMQHFADTHAIFVPLRVEVMRNLASKHPVSALLLRTSNLDLGIEKLAAKVLLNESTPLDLTFGFGAVGCFQYFDQMLQLLSIENTFAADIKSRGLENLPIYKYATYGTLYFDAVLSMVQGYLEVYYPSDQAVVEDSELQNWAKGCAAVMQLRGFPQQFTSLRQLQQVLTHILFQTFVRHHAMNGATSWDSVSVPYSTPALWKKLPTRKLAEGETLNVLDYSIPKQQLPMIVVLSLTFRRHVPDSESLFSLFRAAPFIDEPKLAAVIGDFERSLTSIDTRIVAAEENEKWLYHILRPAMLARYGWV